MSLADEARGLSSSPNRCAFLKLPQPLRGEAFAASRDPDVPAIGLVRALRNRGYALGDKAIRRVRIEGPCTGCICEAPE